jgi:hypothetical protein
VTLLISQKLGIASTSTYNAKNAEKSKKSQTLSEAEGATRQNPRG